MLLHLAPGTWSLSWILAATACVLGLIIGSLATLNYRRLADSNDALPLGLMGLGLLSLPHLSGGIVEGLAFYPLLSALSALMFGFRFTLLLSATCQAINVGAGLGHWDSFGPSMLVSVALPAAWALGFLAAAQRWWPCNFFVYVWINGFFGAAIGTVLCHLVAVVSLIAFGGYEWTYLSRYFLPFGLMMTFPEGFITGAFLTMLVLYRPDWVYTFRDSVYQMDGPPK
ncbi:energy-coupling factor ABC transporter permease [Litorivicinus lipolyticus]|uniref:energy-coupling factor ABC transporter permease n=1 Tax=Litorivicinus lipolyticus TaxID=418701 RepID=UPI003B598772